MFRQDLTQEMLQPMAGRGRKMYENQLRFRAQSCRVQNKNDSDPATVLITDASSLPKSLRYHINILDISTDFLSSVSLTCNDRISNTDVIW